MKITSDLHIHTHHSSCCKDKVNHVPAKIARRASELGLDTIGLADHLWERSDIEPRGFYVRQGVEIINSLRDEVAAISSPVRILIGCEADTLAPGQFTVSGQYAETLDFVLLSCSHFHLAGIVDQPVDRTPRGVARHALDFFNSAARSGIATAIPHPFYPNGFLEIYDEIIASISDVEFLDAFGAAAANDVALEISSHCMDCLTQENPKWSHETPLRVLSLAKTAGCKFTFGSDAHALEKIASVMQLQRIAKNIGLEERHILNLN